jgi:ribose transport system substrate-binding protein
VEPASRTAFPKVAQAAGIVWVLRNCEAEYLTQLRASNPVPAFPAFMVSADNHELDRIQGRQLAALLPDGGSVLYLQGPSLTGVTEQRSAGMFETKPSGVMVKVEERELDRRCGFRAVSSWLRLTTANQGQIHVVQAQNDFLGRSARHRGATLQIGSGSQIAGDFSPASTA